MSRQKLLTVLIDDHAGWHKTVHAHLLSKEHLEVEACSSASEFLYFLPQLPDIVIMDCDLPDIEAGKLIEIIQDYHSECKIIILSGQTNVELIKFFMGELGLEYIVKTDSALDNLDITLKDFIEKKFKLLFMMDDAIEKRNNLLSQFKTGLNSFIKDNSAGEILDHFWDSKRSSK